MPPPAPRSAVPISISKASLPKPPRLPSRPPSQPLLQYKDNSVKPLLELLRPYPAFRSRRLATCSPSSTSRIAHEFITSASFLVPRFILVEVQPVRPHRA